MPRGRHTLLLSIRSRELLDTVQGWSVPSALGKSLFNVVGATCASLFLSKTVGNSTLQGVVPANKNEYQVLALFNPRLI